MKNLFYKIGAGISVIPVLLLPSHTYAQLSDATTKLKSVGDASGQGQNAKESDLTYIIGGIIKAVISVIGIIFVILIIYAGFVYMTANGEDTKITKAKDLMIQGVIGMVIIVSAYAIAGFVLGLLTTATGG